MPRTPNSEDDATAQRDAAGASGPVATGLVVRVTSGLDAGRFLELDSAETPRVLVGKSASCTFRLTDPSVSRRHAALVFVDGALHLQDLQSTNGTTVNGVRIVEAILKPGDVISLGGSSLRIEVAASAAPVPFSDATSFGRIVGASPEMRRLYRLFERIAGSDVNVVIEGETGTGKEVLAESIHEASPRAAGPFVVFDCTAVAANLVESELFGHERGAFTGAVATRKGVFEQAHGGTVFIDEIGELDATLQPKLLRVLERSEVRRVGGDGWIKVDVRVLSATRRDLDREVQDGRFRDDLFFRLNVARVELPPLRHRQGDIGLLAAHFWRSLGGGNAPMPYAVASRFERQDWPGNVRQLRNAVARELALGDLSDLQGASGGAGVGAAGNDPFEQVLAQNLPFPLARDRILAEFERRYVERVLAAQGGSVARAAEASGIARRYFNTILARYTKK